MEEEGGNCILGSREMSLEVRASMAAECSAGVRGILEGLVVARVLETRARCVDWEAVEMERRSVRMRSWVEEGRGRQDLWTREVGMWRVVGVRRARMRVELFGAEVVVGWERERDREGAMMDRGQICTQCYDMERWCGKSLVAARKLAVRMMMYRSARNYAPQRRARRRWRGSGTRGLVEANELFAKAPQRRVSCAMPFRESTPAHPT